MSSWSKDADLLLLSLEAKNPDATSRGLATMMAERGVPVTGDSVQKRLLRLHEQIALDEIQAAQPVQEDEFFGVPTPEGEFVGFRIAFVDIETTDLKAMMGRILCVSIADNWGHVVHRTIYDFEQTSLIDDRGVSLWLRDELEQYDIIIGWNSKMFDIPMLNARLMRWGERPMRMDMMHIDPMYKARAGSSGIRIGSARLVNVSKYFDRNQGATKSDIDWDTWAMAMAGDLEAMKYLVDHCDRDVLVLRSVFNHLKPLIRSIHR